MTEPLITMIVPYYRQPKMLCKQVATWASYPADVRDAFVFLIVDDASPESAASAISRAWYDLPCKMQIYRIDQDVPWNRGMARNLGTKMATTPWVLHVDTDHVLPAEEAAALVADLPNLSAKYWYRFERIRIGAADETRMKDAAPRDATKVDIHPHIDSYLCTPKAYWGAGGYNTRFSGILGGGSPFLKEMVHAHGEPVVLEHRLHVHTRHSIPDSSERTLPRSPEAFKKRKREIMEKYGTLRADPKEALPQPWHRVF